MTRLGAAIELHRQGRGDEAEQAYRAVLAEWPDCAEAEHWLGHLLVTMGRYDEGMAAVDRSITLEPASASYRFDRGNLLLEHGDTVAAAAAYREAVHLEPDLLPAHVNLAAACRQCGRFDEAVAHLRFVIERAPEAVEAHHNLANCLVALGQRDEAIEHYERALALRPEVVDVRMSLGSTLCAIGRYEEAIGHFRTALGIRPGDARIHLQLAHAVKAMGQLTEAEVELRRALAIDPRFAEAWQALANVRRGGANAADNEAMETLLARHDVTLDDRIRLNFALGKAYADAGDAARSFARYEQGNRLHRSRIDYDPARIEAQFDRICQAFEQEPPPLQGPYAPAEDVPRLVFVVGMPRSGTSLIEQILASHPGVYGAGEAPWLAQLIGETFADKVADYPRALVGIRDRYMEQLRLQAARQGRSDATVICDKMPHNFRFVGFIAHLWPDAVILHTRRHPLDVCLSCYEQFFVESHPYAYDLEELGRYYLAYERLMTYWHARYPGRICDVDYARLVRGGEPALRWLIARAGLDWDPACLEFYRARRAVTTASDAQVRQPLYRSSIERWRRYAEELIPLRRVLEAGGVLTVDGERVERRDDGRGV